MLKVQNISAGYGKLQILNGMSLEVKKNSLTAMLCGNGCGKSTTLKAITGLIKPASGDILFEGQSLLGTKPQDIVKKGIAYVTQGKDVFPSLTVEENLLLGAYTIKDRAEISKNVEGILKWFMTSQKWQRRSENLVESAILSEQENLTIQSGGLLKIIHLPRLSI